MRTKDMVLMMAGVGYESAGTVEMRCWKRKGRTFFSVTDSANKKLRIAGSIPSDNVTLQPLLGEFTHHLHELMYAEPIKLKKKNK